MREWKEALHLLLSCFRILARGPWRVRETIQETVRIGIGSLPIITLSTAFSGMVVSDQITWHVDQAIHSLSLVPGFTGLFILRELGIAVPALLLVSKVGASITAEVGSMKVTEQIDALRLLRISPVEYLVFPRFVACVASLFCLTLLSVAVTLACATAIAVWKYGFFLGEYWNTLRHFVKGADLLCAATKSIVFGAVIPVISCAQGFHCRGGAEGVGTATTQAVVNSTLAVIVLDFILTYLFTWIL